MKKQKKKKEKKTIMARGRGCGRRNRGVEYIYYGG